MSFIGNTPAESYSTVVKDTFSGNDSTTDFTLSIPATTNSVEVLVENVQQEPTTAYTISGTTLSFTAAPVTGTNNIYVIHRGPAVQQVTPPAGVAIDASTVTASGDVSIADKIVHTGDTNTAIRFPAADTVTVETGGSERVRVDSSGNVGIGTTNPSYPLHISKSGDANSISQTTSTSGEAQFFVRNSNGDGGLAGALIYGSAKAAYGALGSGEAAYYSNRALTIMSDGDIIKFATGGNTERMRIASNGYLQCAGVYNQSAADSANVVVDGSGNIYRSTSALKYKQDVRDLESIDISSFRPVRYKSNIERDDQTLDHFGFIADEFHDAGLTELVSYGVVDEETGIAEVEGFRYDRMTAVLTKALQEAIAKIETLETTVADLQTRVTALESV